jgi:hypothetical protein
MISKIKSGFGSRKKMVVIPIVIVALLLLLPEAARFFTIKSIRNLGAESVSLRDLDINPFAGIVVVKDLKIGKNTSDHIVIEKLLVNLSLLSLFKKQILIDDLFLSGLDVSLVKTDETLHAGFPVVSGGENNSAKKEEAASGFMFGLRQFNMDRSSITFSAAGLLDTIVIEGFSVNDIFSWDHKTSAAMRLSCSVNGSPLSVISSMSLFSPQKNLIADIKLAGFDLKRLGIYTKDFIEDFKGSADINCRLEAAESLAGDIKIMQNGSVNFNDLAGVIPEKKGEKPTPEMTLNEADLSWSGELAVNLSKEFRLSQFVAEGEMANGSLDVYTGGHVIDLRHEGFSWSGKIQGAAEKSDENPDNSKTHSVADSMKLAGKVLLSGLVVKSETEKITIMALDSFQVNEISVNGLDDISAKQILLNNCIIAGNGENSLMKNEMLAVSGVTLLKKNNLTVKSVEAGHLAALVILDAQKKLPLVDKCLQALTIVTPHAELKSDNSAPEVKMPEQDKAAFSLNIGSVSVTPGSTFKFVDNSLKPAFSQKIKIVKAVALNISNGKENPAEIDIRLVPQKHATIDLSGTVFPMAYSEATSLDLAVKNLNLVPLSPYISQKIGYLVKTGALNFDTGIKINQSKLDISNEITLNKIKLSPDDEDKINRVIAQLTLPLDYTLSVLRDKKGDVSLSIPVTGNIENPDFNLNRIYAITAAKALKTASISYLKHLLQPYGALITVANLSMDYLGKINLDPVMFDKNSVECSQENIRYLETLAGLLTEKDDLTLSVFGLALPVECELTDPAEKQKQLFFLANSRAEAIREVLVSKGITPGRIIMGHPEIDKDEKAMPMVKLGI